MSGTLRLNVNGQFIPVQGFVGPTGPQGEVGPTGPEGAPQFQLLTQAQYDALNPPIPGVLYLIEAD